jgi:hypothetical protein
MNRLPGQRPLSARTLIRNGSGRVFGLYAESAGILIGAGRTGATGRELGITPGEACPGTVTGSGIRCWNLSRVLP